jgi:hypothetical protein
MKLTLSERNRKAVEYLLSKNPLKFSVQNVNGKMHLTECLLLEVPQLIKIPTMTWNTESGLIVKDYRKDAYGSVSF